MRVAYFYFMKQQAELVRAIAPRHASYWNGLAMDAYRGGPFADQSGGLILFDSDTEEHAEQLVAGDPFRREGLLDQHWIKRWLADADESNETGGQTPDRARDEVTT